jgi:hypothetical protein
MNRVSESLVYGAVFGHADTEVTGVFFYPPEIEPRVSAQTKWVEVVVELSDIPSSGSDWIGGGTIKMFIQARKSAGNIYAGKAIAHSLSEAFTKTAIDVENDASEVVGQAKFKEPVSKPLGMEDGIIHHYWQIEFDVYSAT